MIVLDTNVVSELMRTSPSTLVVAWIDAQPTDDVFLSVITAAELLYGVGRLPTGRRRNTLRDQLDAMLRDDFRDRIIPIDEVVAHHYADIVVRRERAGRPISMADALIAATCRRHDAVLATRNTDDFTGIDMATVNPWLEATS